MGPGPGERKMPPAPRRKRRSSTRRSYMKSSGSGFAASRTRRRVWRCAEKCARSQPKRVSSSPSPQKRTARGPPRCSPTQPRWCTSNAKRPTIATRSTPRSRSPAGSSSELKPRSFSGPARKARARAPRAPPRRCRRRPSAARSTNSKPILRPRASSRSAWPSRRPPVSFRHIRGRMRSSDLYWASSWPRSPPMPSVDSIAACVRRPDRRDIQNERAHGAAKCQTADRSQGWTIGAVEIPQRAVATFAYDATARGDANGRG